MTKLLSVVFVSALAFVTATPALAQATGITLENRANLDANVTMRNVSGKTLWSGRIPHGRTHVVEGCSGKCEVKFQWITGHAVTGNQICETTVSNQAVLHKIAQSDVPDNMLAVYDGSYDTKTAHCAIQRRR